MVSPYVLLKSAIFTLFAPGTVAGIIPQLLARRDRGGLPVGSRVARWMGGISLVLGVLLYLHTAWRFSDEGKGTPAPIDEPKELVTGGIYSYVRNPMYLAVLLCIGGQALLYKSVLVLWWTVGCWVIVHIRVIGYEEPHLIEKYDIEYKQYCKRVPRWIPRLRSADNV